MSTATDVHCDRSGRQLTAYLSGDLDAESAPRLTERIIGNMRSGDECVWVDLAQVEFCGSAGIAMFVRIHTHAAQIGARFRLYNPTPMVRRTIEICELDQVLPVWTD